MVCAAFRRAVRQGGTAAEAACKKRKFYRYGDDAASYKPSFGPASAIEYPITLQSVLAEIFHEGRAAQPEPIGRMGDDRVAAIQRLLDELVFQVVQVAFQVETVIGKPGRQEGRARYALLPPRTTPAIHGERSPASGTAGRPLRRYDWETG